MSCAMPRQLLKPGTEWVVELKLAQDQNLSGSLVHADFLAPPHRGSFRRPGGGGGAAGAGVTSIPEGSTGSAARAYLDFLCVLLSSQPWGRFENVHNKMLKSSFLKNPPPRDAGSRDTDWGSGVCVFTCCLVSWIKGLHGTRFEKHRARAHDPPIVWCCDSHGNGANPGAWVWAGDRLGDQEGFATWKLREELEVMTWKGRLRREQRMLRRRGKGEERLWTMKQ